MLWNKRTYLKNIFKVNEHTISECVLIGKANSPGLNEAAINIKEIAIAVQNLTGLIPSSRADSQAPSRSDNYSANIATGNGGGLLAVRNSHDKPTSGPANVLASPRLDS